MNNILSQKSYSFSDEANRLISEFKSKKPIRVKQLSNPHDLVLKTKKLLGKAEPNKYRILQSWGKKHMDVRVGPKRLNRALRVMNTIVKFLVKQRIEVHTGDSDRNTHIVLFDEKISFFIREPTNRHDYIPTAKEKAEEERRGWASYEKYYHVPFSRLCLEINEYGCQGIKKNWLDGKNKQIEDYLKDFIVNLVLIADLHRTRRIKREEEHRLWEIERQRQVKLGRLRQIEEERRRELENQAEGYAKSLQIRDFIKATEASASVRGLSPDSNSEFQRWLQWATTHADRLDPLTGHLPFEPDDEDGYASNV